MKNITTEVQKVIASSIIVALVLPLFVIPQKAEAQLVVSDPGSYAFQAPTLAHNLVTATQAIISGAHDSQDTLVTFVLKPLALAMGRAAIKSMTMSTVNWINGGFHGKPAFETNLKNSLRNLGDAIAQDYLTELATDGRLHSPFMDKIAQGVSNAYYLYTGREALAARLKYTLNQNAADDKAFLAGDFKQGGWNAWFSAFSEPANNPYGAQMIAAQVLTQNVSDAAVQRVQELGWGSGFISWRGDCQEAVKIDDDITTLGGATTDADGNLVVTTNTQHVSFNSAEKCVGNSVVTPGSFFENKLNITTDSPLRQLELAQSIDAIVGALAQQLISKVLSSTGLLGTSQPSSGGGASSLSRATYTTPEALSSINGFRTAIALTISQVTTWKKDVQTIETIATSAKASCVSNTQALATIVEPALTQAREDTVRANISLTKLAALQTQIQAASDSGSGEYSQVATGWQQLLAGTDLPTSDEMTQAATESRDSGPTPPTSLFTTLTKLATNCQTGT